MKRNKTYDFARCKPCRDGRSRNCSGWSIEGRFDFRQCEIKKNYIYPVVVGRFSTAGNPSPEQADRWLERPVSEASCAVEVWSLRDHKMLARHHVDMANRQQHGPVWHVQYGGKSSGGERSCNEWLDLPRWPTVPMDIILTLELVAYNFFHEEWKRLCKRGSWRGVIKRTEGLILGHYYRRMGSYHNQEGAGHSWLAYQCNSEWNPRPV